MIPTKDEIAPPPESSAAAALSAAAQSSGGKLRYAAVIVAVLVIIGAGAGLVPRWHHRIALGVETQRLAIQTVSIVSPAPGKAAPGLTLPAEVKPLLEAPIYARVSGYLKRYLVDIGAQVKGGDLLAEIDTPELNQELAQARAQLTQAEAALALAKTTAARWAELLKTASVSEQEAAEKQADFELKTANVEAARANGRRLEEMQSFERVTAPFSGTVTARGTDVGQLIAASSGKELFHLAQTGTLRVFVRVPQTASRGVAVGQLAEFSLPELPGRVFPAKLVRTAGAMSTDSRTLLAELEVDNSRGEILPGSYAQVRFTQSKLETALSLPSNALLFRAEGPQVGVVGSEGKVELRNVALGRDSGSTVEILGGINATDRVILNPSDSLVSGMVVHIADASDKEMQAAKPATQARSE